MRQRASVPTWLGDGTSTEGPGRDREEKEPRQGFGHPAPKHCVAQLLMERYMIPTKL